MPEHGCIGGITRRTSAMRATGVLGSSRKITAMDPRAAALSVMILVLGRVLLVRNRNIVKQ